jgi:hypothetical protein
MKVKELIEQLSKHDPDMKVKFSYYFEGDEDLSAQWLIADIGEVGDFQGDCVMLRDY